MLARNMDRAAGRVPKPSRQVIQRAETDRPETDSDVRGFARDVTRAMDGPILRYSHRQKLIRRAEQLGIGRFDANLLIAAVQHRSGIITPLSESHAQEYGSRLLGIGFAITLQAMIAVAAWMLLHS